MIDISITTLAGLCIVFFATLTYGLTGFGFALVAIPLFMILLPPQVAVPIVSIMGNLSSLVLLYESRKQADPSRVWLMIIAGLIGAPLGTYLLLILDAGTLKVLVGMTVAVCATALLKGQSWPIPNERLASVVVGFTSGLLGASTGIGGPPVILFFSNQRSKKEVFRANLVLFFTLTSLWTLLTQWMGGLVTPKVLSHILWFLPALLLGTLAGIYMARQVSEKVFRRLVLSILIITGLSAILSGLGLF